MQSQIASQDIINRLQHMDKQAKWDRFRLARKALIERYIQLRKRQKMIQDLIRLAAVQQLVKASAKNYKEHHAECLIKMKGRFLNL